MTHIIFKKDGKKVAEQHINTDVFDTIHIEHGGEVSVITEKLYGPWAPAPVRIRLDYPACEWIVEQEHQEEVDDDPPPPEWREVARFPADVES